MQRESQGQGLKMEHGRCTQTSGEVQFWEAGKTMGGSESWEMRLKEQQEVSLGCPVQEHGWGRTGIVLHVERSLPLGPVPGAWEGALDTLKRRGNWLP